MYSNHAHIHRLAQVNSNTLIVLIALNRLCDYEKLLHENVCQHAVPACPNWAQLALLSPSVMWLVSVTWSQVWMGSRCVKFGVIALILSYWSLEVLVTGSTTWHLMAKNSLKKIVALQKDGVGYEKIAKTLKLSCSTMAKTIQPFHRTGSTQIRPYHGRPKKLSARAQHHIQRLCLWKDIWVGLGIENRFRFQNRILKVRNRILVK